jgi:hypothetical protein
MTQLRFRVGPDDANARLEILWLDIRSLSDAQKEQLRLRRYNDDVFALRWSPTLLDGRRFSRSCAERSPVRLLAPTADVEGLAIALERDAEKLAAVPQQTYTMVGNHLLAT